MLGCHRTKNRHIARLFFAFDQNIFICRGMIRIPARVPDRLDERLFAAIRPGYHFHSCRHTIGHNCRNHRCNRHNNRHHNFVRIDRRNTAVASRLRCRIDFRNKQVARTNMSNCIRYWIRYMKGSNTSGFDKDNLCRLANKYTTDRIHRRIRQSKRERRTAQKRSLSKASSIPQR